jgi:hypothetical protein
MQKNIHQQQTSSDHNSLVGLFRSPSLSSKTSPHICKIVQVVGKLKHLY